MNRLKKLDLGLMNIEYIDPKAFIQTPMLDHLRIHGISFKLDENMFVHLKNLKTIEIDKSYIDKIDSSLLGVLRKFNSKIEIIIN